MAVRTQQPQILQAVVIPLAVHVVKLERNRCSHPIRQTTRLTSRFFQAFAQQTQFQLVRVRYPTQDQDLGKWPRCLPRTLRSLAPGLSCEMTHVQAEARDCGAHRGVVSAGWSKAEQSKGLCDCGGVSERAGDVVLCVRPSLHGHRRVRTGHDSDPEHDVYAATVA